MAGLHFPATLSSMPVIMKSSAYRTRFTLGLGFFCGELFPQKFFQSVQGQVRQGWGNYPALRSARFRGEEGSIFHIPGFQPLAQHLLVRGHMAAASTRD